MAGVPALPEQAHAPRSRSRYSCGVAPDLHGCRLPDWFRWPRAWRHRMSTAATSVESSSRVTSEMRSACERTHAIATFADSRIHRPDGPGDLERPAAGKARRLGHGKTVGPQPRRPATERVDVRVEAAHARFADQELDGGRGETTARRRTIRAAPRRCGTRCAVAMRCLLGIGVSGRWRHRLQPLPQQRRNAAGSVATATNNTPHRSSGGPTYRSRKRWLHAGSRARSSASVAASPILSSSPRTISGLSPARRPDVGSGR